jgi:hypothetical protein
MTLMAKINCQGAVKYQTWHWDGPSLYFRDVFTSVGPSIDEENFVVEKGLPNRFRSAGQISTLEI